MEFVPHGLSLVRQGECMSTLEELREALKMLGDAESIKDESVRKRLQHAILDAVEAPRRHDQDSIVISDPLRSFFGPPYYSSSADPQIASIQNVPQHRHQRTLVNGLPRVEHRTPEGRKAKYRRVYEAVEQLATRDAPLSATDLEDIVDSDLKVGLAKDLSRMHSRGYLRRVQVACEDRSGRKVNIFKYYVDQPSRESIDDLLLRGTPQTP